MATDPYAEFQKPAAATADPYAEFQKPAAAPTPAPESHPVSDFASNFGAAINPLPGLKQAITHPIDTAKGAVNAQLDQFKQAGQDFSNTKEMPNLSDRLMSAGGHALAGMVPLVGPAAAHAGEQIGSGDVAGGMGTGAGLIAGFGLPKVTEGLGKAIKAPAGPIAETAMGIRGAMREHGATPGHAILNDTEGLRPETVERTGTAKQAELTNELENRAKNAQGTIKLNPARKIVSNAIDTAKAGNSVPSDLTPLQEHLTVPHKGFAGAVDQPPAPMVPTPSAVLGPNGQPIMTMAPGKLPPAVISDAQTPTDFLSMKRRFGKDHTNFRPGQSTPESMEVANHAYGQMARDFNSAVPGGEALNQRIQSLIPVTNRAHTVSLADNAGQKILGRIAKPTGALAAGLTGAYEGGKHFGVPGAIAGGAAGLGIPELIASPTVQMAVARGLHGTGKALASPVGSQIAGRTAQSGALLKSKRKDQK